MAKHSPKILTSEEKTTTATTKATTTFQECNSCFLGNELGNLMQSLMLPNTCSKGSFYFVPLENQRTTVVCGIIIIIITIIIYPLTARVIGAPQMISQPVSSIFPSSPLPSGTWWTPGLSTFPDVVFPPLPLSALSSSPFVVRYYVICLSSYFHLRHMSQQGLIKLMLIVTYVPAIS